MSNELKLTRQYIENRIYLIRNEQVMLDRDLAEMYQVETKVLNQAVKRNIERFPNSFRFQLTEDEYENLKSQIVTSSNKHGRRRYMPYAFTEQGVAMLSAVLRSDIAIQVSISIMNTFVQIRKLIGQETIQQMRLNNIENRLVEHDKKFDKLFEALEQNELPERGVYFQGQIFDAYVLASKIVRSAKKSIVLIDNYIDENTLVHLAKKRKNVKAVLLCKNINSKLKLDLKKVNEQYGNFELKPFSNSHDRFLIIDDKEVYHIGASIKDLGKKWFAFSKMDPKTIEKIMEDVKKQISN